MRLNVSRSKNSASLYVIKSTWENKVHSTVIVEKLGTEAELREKLNGRDPYEWAKEYIAELNRQEKEGTEPPVIAKYSPSSRLEKDVQQSFHGGYLFLQRLYSELGFPKICEQITKKHAFEYDLNSILSRLLYTRILFPGSKRSTCELSKRFIEQPNFDLHQIYRALDVLDTESDLIQSELYKNSLKLSKRNTNILYYDCTNYFFEIKQEKGIKQYGISKEHRPNPIVQMGLFMDGDGIPLAFSIQAGNTNEQQTIKPLEKQILQDFRLSKFVVCTDAGLACHDNREYNTMGDRAFVVTQSIKQLAAPLREWALEPKGWRLNGEDGFFDLTTLDEEKYQKYRNSVFFKEQWVTITGLKQRMVVTYSLTYRDHQRNVREGQINRAIQAIQNGASKVSKCNPNDYKRFITQTHCTKEGEVSKKTLYHLNQEAIAREAAFDGFYAVCTNLEADAADIVRVNKRRWEIEECFRIMKSEFKARPVYLSLDQRIQAHFMTCFLSLVLYRYLEKRLGERFTCQEIISQLREMNFKHCKDFGYIPTYTRTDLMDALHEAFGFRTDYEILTLKKFKEIQKLTKLK